MKLRLLEFLSCPDCGHRPLRLETFTEEDLKLSGEHLDKCKSMGIDPASVSKEVVDGILCCDNCQTWFPIKNRIPILHKFAHPFHESFHAEFASTSQLFSTFHPPRGEGKPGESKTLRNYTATWETTGDDDLVFYLSLEQEKTWFRAVLDWPDWVLTKKNLRVLDIGVGYGHEARIIESLTDGEVFGVDLNLSLLTSSHLFANEPFIHLISCSLFDIPLPKKDFDVVISMGVLHHTFSTEEAFKAIVTHMRDSGALAIWLYWSEDFGGPFKQILIRLRELALRPVISRLPVWAQRGILFVWGSLYYPIEKKKVPNPDKWKLANTIKHLRDRYTPIYAYRHQLFEPYIWMEHQDMICNFVDMNKFKEVTGYWNYGLSLRGVKRPVATDVYTSDN